MAVVRERSLAKRPMLQQWQTLEFGEPQGVSEKPTMTLRFLDIQGT